MEAEPTPLTLPAKEELSIIMKALGTIEDTRQTSKVRYRIADVILLAVAAVASEAESWVQMEIFGKSHAAEFKELLGIAAIPSHDTIERVISIVNPAILHRIYQLWCRSKNFKEETPASLKGLKLLNIDGKTIRGSAGRGKKAIHVETAWDPQKGECLAQCAVDEKSNEITAIPKLFDTINPAGYIVTSDAMGTQTAIAGLIADKGGDYVLAVKGNQGTLLEELSGYAADKDLLRDLEKQGLYKRTVEKAHSQIEIREYWQTDQIQWVSNRGKWKKLTSVGFERSTIKKQGKTSTTWRYFICSLEADIEMFAEAVRGHWQIEAMHNVLDVTMKEDANKTIERTAAENLNIIRKWIYTILRQVDTGKPTSMRNKRYFLSQNPTQAIQMLL